MKEKIIAGGAGFTLAATLLIGLNAISGDIIAPAKPVTVRMTAGQARTCVSSCLSTHFPGVAPVSINKMTFNARRNGKFGAIKHVDVEVRYLNTKSSDSAYVDDLAARGEVHRVP